VHLVIKRMKQQLLGGYGDVLPCKKSTTESKKEMHAWLDRKQDMLVAEFLLSSKERMTLGVGAIFWFISHKMPCQPEGLGIHIYRLLASQAYAKMLSKMLV
jgi:hypothetical protein